MRYIKILLCVILSNISAVTFAADRGLYLGLQGGYGFSGWSDLDTKHNKIEVKNAGGFTGRLSVGYDVNKNFAVEAGYTYIFGNSTVKDYSLKVPTSASIGTQVFDVMGKLQVITEKNLGLYGKLGADYIYSSEHWNDQGGGHGAISVAYGVGVFYNFLPNWTGDVSWTRYSGNPSMDTGYIPNVDFYAVGIKYKF
jgi:opacity protein-like surface antigen